VDLRDPWLGVAAQAGAGALRTPPELDLATWIVSIDRESAALVRAAEAAGLGAPVPTCPGWQVRDLARHLGGVQRWATAHVAEGRRESMPKQEVFNLMASYPRDDLLLQWFEQGARRLRQVLAEAPHNLECWSFLPSPSPLEFWARRQAHETEVHRADAEIAAGSGGVTFPAEIAGDGIDEMLFGFAVVRHRPSPAPPLRLALLAQDLPLQWQVQLGPEGIQAERGSAEADCQLRGTASNLFLWLWNRLPVTALSVAGNQEVVKRWSQTMRVRWS